MSPAHNTNAKRFTQLASQVDQSSVIAKLRHNMKTVSEFLGSGDVDTHSILSGIQSGIHGKESDKARASDWLNALTEENISAGKPTAAITICNLESELRRAQDQIANLKADNEDQTTRIRAKDRQLDKLQRESADAITKLSSQLKETISRARQDVRDAKEANEQETSAKLRKKDLELRQRNKSASERFKSQLGKSEALQEALDTALEETKATKESHGRAKSMLEKARAEILNLRDDKSRLESDLQEFSASLEKISKDHASTTAIFEAKHSKLAEVNQDLESQIVALFEENRKLRKALSAEVNAGRQNQSSIHDRSQNQPNISARTPISTFRNEMQTPSSVSHAETRHSRPAMYAFLLRLRYFLSQVSRFSYFFMFFSIKKASTRTGKNAGRKHANHPRTARKTGEF